MMPFFVGAEFGVRPDNVRMVMRRLVMQRNRATRVHRGQFSNASRPIYRGSSSSSSYQPRLTCGWPLLWMGVRAATTAVVSQTTRHESAGCGMGVVPRDSDRSTGG